jgi:hypothetical protein
VDGIAAQGTGVDPIDEKNHLAKVRVAGSNPVVRSKDKSWSEAFSYGQFLHYPRRCSVDSLDYHRE